MSRFPTSLTARDWSTTVSALKSFVQQTFPELASDLTDSNLGVMLMGIAAYVGDTTGFATDSAALEVFTSTASRTEGPLKFARSIGYFPRTAKSAVTLLLPTSIPSVVQSNGAVVRKGQLVGGVNSLSYEVVSDTVILPGATGVAAGVLVREGRTRQETYAFTGLAGMEVVTSRPGVDYETWRVYVGKPVEVNRWTQVPFLGSAGRDAKVYEASVDSDGKLRVRFGDGISGGAIPDQNVTLVYRTTAGLSGNVPSGVVRGSLSLEVNGTSQVVSVEYVNSSDPASGGADMESLEELRANIPAYIRSAVSAVLLPSIEGAALRFPGVTLSFADLVAQGNKANVVRLSVWGSELVDLVSERAGSDDTVTVPYVRFAQAGQAMADDVAARMRELTVVTMHTAVARPTVAWADVYIPRLSYDSSKDPADVHAAVASAVVSVFQRGGLTVRLSDLYRAVEEVDGVDSFLIDRVVFENNRRAHAVGSLWFRSDGPMPVTGDRVSIDDGVRQVTFEFTTQTDGNGNPAPSTSSYVGVRIGPNFEACAENLVQAASVRGLLRLTVYRDPLESRVIVRFRHLDPGTNFNRPIIVAGPTVEVESPSGGASTFYPAASRLVAVGLSGGSDVPGDGQPAQGSIVFAALANPADGATVTISDGSLTKVFEFDSNSSVVSGRVAVPITASNVHDTVNALVSAINASGLAVTAVNRSEFSDPYVTLTVALTNNAPGAEGNVALTTTSPVLQVNGMFDGTGYRYSNIDDQRREMTPAVDPWPAGPYVPGPVGSFQDGGVRPYVPLADLDKKGARSTRRYYDDSFLFANQIYFDSLAARSLEVQAVNLRRLVIGLTPTST